MSDATALGIPDSHADLIVAPLAAVLTTNGPDGLPQSTAVWYVLADGELKTSVLTTRQKYKNLQREPRATLFIMDPASPWRTLELRSDVDVRPDPDRIVPQQYAVHYGTDGTSMDPPGSERAMIVFRPRHVVVFG